MNFNRLNRANLTKNAQAALGRPAVKVATGNGPIEAVNFEPQIIEQQIAKLTLQTPLDFVTSVQSVPISIAAQLDFKPTKVVTLTMPTKSDMAYYSEEMELERVEIVELLKQELTQLSLMLQASGVYAEAVDPCTGQFMHHQQQLTTPICESDMRLGALEQFSVKDVGCCQILQHAQYGSRAVTGFLFVA